MNLRIVFANWLYEAVPPFLFLLYLSDLLHLVLGQGIWSIVHVRSHESTVLCFAEGFWINLWSQEGDLSWSFHRFLNIVYHLVFVASIFIEDKWGCVHRTSKFRLGLRERLHRSTTLVTKSRTCSDRHCFVWKSCNRALRCVLAEEFRISQCWVVELVVVVLWTIKEFTIRRMKFSIILWEFYVEVLYPTEFSINISFLWQLWVIRHSSALYFILIIWVKLSLWVDHNILLVLEVFIKVQL